MAASTSTIFWPVAFVMAAVMVVFLFMISDEATNSIEVHVSDELAEVATRSLLYTSLNVRDGTNLGGWMSEGRDGNRPDITGYRKLSLKWCGNDNILQDQLPNEPQKVIEYLRIKAEVPETCANSGKKTIYQHGSPGGETDSIIVKIPVRGGELLEINATYRGKK